MRWSLRSGFAGWTQTALQALLPSSCALCGGRCNDAVCQPCCERYMVPRAARCPRCANPCAPGDAFHPCGACRAMRFDATIAAADYAAPLDRLVLELKFGGCLALAPWCALRLRDCVLRRRGPALPNLLCPVPLGRTRLAQRGYNQALEIARPLSRALGIPLHARLAIRALETNAQSSVEPGARRENIRNAFIVAPDALALMRGQHIGIVDDVMSSGHTLNELAGLFKRFGAARVTNFVFARTPPH